MGYTYILVIWTVVAIQGQGTGNYILHRDRDWRPIGEFHLDHGRLGGKTALEMCEEAARQLNLNPDRYRCVRSK
jgi:hypothetical protein